MTAARVVPILVLLGLAALVGAGTWLLSETPGTLLNEAPPVLGPTREPAGELIVVTVNEGASAEEIGKKLEEAGVVESGRLFRVLASLLGVSDAMAAGDYEFEHKETALSAVQRVSQGVTASLVVTIPEGLRAEEIGELLEERSVVAAEDFLAALEEAYTAPFLTFQTQPGEELEGFLFPATYGFSRSVTPHEAVQQMLDAFDQRYREEVRPLLPQAGGRTLREVVTLASIVEREAVLDEERPLIAGVFQNRLAAGGSTSLLGADPTVFYGLDTVALRDMPFDDWQRFTFWLPPGVNLQDVTLPEDLAAYNSYQVRGLPAGPICTPSLPSIEAALAPNTTDGYFFFLAIPDGGGAHAFAKTEAEHDENRRKYGYL
jgi:UPF0755 protein